MSNIVSFDEFKKKNGTNLPTSKGSSQVVSFQDFKVRNTAQGNLKNSAQAKFYNYLTQPKQVETAQDKRNTWFNTGAKGNILQKTAGTVGDIGLNVVKGIAGAGEKLGDLASYGVAGVADVLGAKDYAKNVRESAQVNLVGNALQPVTNQVNQYSLTGDKLDSIVQSVGESYAMAQVGGALGKTKVAQKVGLGDALNKSVKLGKLNINIPLMSVLTGASSGITEAYQKGGDNQQAFIKGLTSGLAEGISEGIFGVFGQGGSSFEQEVMYKATKKIENELARRLTKLGITAAGEGAEEGISYAFNYVADNLQDIVNTSLGKEINKMGDKWNWNEFGENILSGAIAGGLSGGAELLGGGRGAAILESTQHQVENTLNRALTDAEVATLAQETEKQLNNGKINIDQIVNRLQNPTVEDLVQQQGIKSDTTPQLDSGLQQQLQLPTQNFTVDTSGYSGTQLQTYQNAINSGLLNNNKNTHDFVDFVSKISKDKGIVFNFTNNQALQDRNINAQINGYIDNNGITLNVDSNMALEKVIGHEITHTLENMVNEYDNLKNSFKQLLGEEEFNTRLEQIKELYKGIEGANYENELISDLAGEYLFTNEEFINRLSTEKPSLFRRIYQEIKYLWKMATGTEQEKQLAKTMRIYEQAYKNAGKVTTYQTDNFAQKTQNAQETQTTPQETKPEIKKYPNLTEEEAKEYEFLDSLPFDLTGEDLQTYERLQRKMEGKPNLPTRKDIQFKDIARDYGRYKDLEGYNAELTKDAESLVPGRNGKRTKDQWLDVASFIGERFKGNDEQLKKYAIQSWLAERPNNKENLNRQGKGYVKFTIEEWLNKIYDAANRTKPITQYSISAYRAGDEKGTMDSGTFYAENEIDAGNYGKPSKYDINDSAKLYNGVSTQEYAENNNLMNKKDSKLKEKLGVETLQEAENIYENWQTPSYLDKNPNLRLWAYQYMVKKDLESKGYDGAIWSNEDELTPKQYQIWNDNVVEKNKTTKYSLSQDNQGRELTKEQQEFFKDSKARDENGELLTMYHSTPENFTIFDKTKLGENTGYNNTDFGFFVTPSKAFSERFKDVDNRGVKGNTMELYANIKKPIIHPFGAGAKFEGEELDNIVRNYLTETDNLEGLKQLEEQVKLNDDGSTLYDLYRYLAYYEGALENSKQEREILEKKGYDAVEFIEGEESGIVEGSKNNDIVSSYAVFNSNQLKNVDNKKPTSNPDIRYSLSDNQGRELTKAQQEYFDGETPELLDDDGRLVELYHGTSEDFTVFDINKIGGNTNNEGLFGKGFYLTNNPELAEGYSKYRKGNQKVLKVYAKMTNPFVWKNIKTEEQMNQFIKDNNIPEGTIRWNPYQQEIHTITEIENERAFSKALQEAGYDGIIYEYRQQDENHTPVKEVVVFNSNQIKNVDNKKPTSNPDIRYSLSVKEANTGKDSQGRTLNNNQINFFRDSKITDENGNLIPLYHGSNSEFTVFDINKSGESNKAARVGFWFTPNRTGAENFASDVWYGDNKPTTYEVYLNIKNPKIYESYDNTEQTNALDQQYKDTRDREKALYNKHEYDEIGLSNVIAFMNYKSEEGTLNTLIKDFRYTEEEARDYINDVRQVQEIRKETSRLERERANSRYTDAYEQFRTDIYKIAGKDAEDANFGGLGMMLNNERQVVQEYVDSLKAQGYDGIIIKNTRYDAATMGGNNDQYVAFYSNQIKNVDNLNPTENDDIRYQLSQKQENLPIGQFRGKNVRRDINVPTTQENALNVPLNRQKRVLNPTEISNLNPEDANTTPILPTTRTLQGDKQSRFLNNINQTEMLTQESKDLINNANIGEYRSVTNEESLKDASEKLSKGGKAETERWFRNDPKNVNATDIAEGFILLNQYQEIARNSNNAADKYQANQSMVEVAKKLRQIGTEAGQTLQAYSILSRMTPEGMVYYAQSELTDAYNEMVKNKSREWINQNRSNFELTPEETQFILDTMNQVSTMEDGYDKKVKLAEIQKLMTDKLPPAKGQKIKSWMRLSMLFNPKTQVRNVAGNTLIVPVNSFSDIFASYADKLVSRKTGKRTTGTTNIKAMLEGFKKGAYEATTDYKKGINTRDIEGNRFEIGEGKSFSDKSIIGKALNNTEGLLNYVMDAGDRVFSEAAFENSLQNQLKLNNTNEITQDMIDIARQESLSRTWNDNNNYTQFVLNVRSMLNKINFGTYGLGDVLIPFAKTPANLTKAIVDYSPVGFVNTLLKGQKLSRSLENGQYTPQLQHDFVQTLGKATAGTMLYVLGMALAKAGITSGESDEDKDTQNFLKNTLGISNYSIKLGGKSFTYDWAQPIAAPLSITANIANRKDKEQALGEAIISNLDTASSVLLEQSFMQGINEVLNGNGGIVDGMVKQVLELPARAVPTLSKQIVDLTDSTQRTSYEYNKPVESAINAVKAKIPGLSQTLAPVVDTMGREVQRYGGKNNLFNVFLNPANVNTENISEAASEIYEVYKATGDKTIMPRVAPYYINQKGEKITLNSKQKAEFQTISGSIIEENMNDLINNQAYQNLNDTEKASMINDLVNYAYNKARKDVLNIDMSNTYNKINEFVKDGGTPAEYYTNKEEIDYAYTNPSKYQTIRQITTYNMYKNYNEGIKDIKTKYSTTDERKNAIINYVNSLELGIPQKAMLIRMNYSSFKQYDNLIIDYINSQDLTVEQKSDILKEIGFTIKNGVVYN